MKRKTNGAASFKSLAEYLSACGFVAEIKIKPLPNASKE